MKKFTISILSLLCLTACGPDKVSFNTLEAARDQARSNAVENAQTFRATDPRFTDLEIIARGDSTQSDSCPQGDGWASIDFNRKGTQGFLKVKCSTVSRSLGCMTDADFKGREQYAKQENKCNATLPFPIPKLTQ